MKTHTATCIRTLCYCLLLCILAPLARAQPHTTVLFPVNAQMDVGIDASIVVRGTHNIVPVAVTHAWPDEESPGWRANEPTILLVDDERVANIPRWRWARYAIAGKYSFDNVMTLRFTPRVPLREGVRYRCIIDGLLLNVHGALQRAASQNFTFTTAVGVPTIKATTFDSVSVVTCTQSVYINFSTIDDRTLADAASKIRVSSTSDADNSNVVPPHVIDLHPDLRMIELRPIGHWPLQRTIMVDMPWGQITGDPHDSKTWGMVARGASRLTLDVKSTDGRTVPQEIINYYNAQSQIVSSSQRTTITTPSWFTDRWRFVRWESDDVSVADSVDINRLDVELSCEQLQGSLAITAVVSRIDTMRVVVDVEGEGMITARDADNNIVAEFEATDSIAITDDLPSFMLTASPKNGHTFSSWSGVLWNTSTASTVTATPQAFAQAIAGAKQPSPTGGQGGGTQQPNGNAVLVNANVVRAYVKPNFPNTPLGPVGERYLLEAAIADESPEPSHPANEGVAFTTPSFFTDVLQSERTPCVRAEPCWEIVSVNDAAEGNGNRALPSGTEEACETALLTIPGNYVTFNVRRRRMQMRIERVLITSDNADDVIAGRRLHPESYVIVEKQQGVEGAYFWKTISSATCQTTDNIEYNTYDVRCGDVIRFRVRGSKVRGETWKFFANRQGYVVPGNGESDRDESIYMLVVDRDLAQFEAKNCNGDNLDKPEIRLRACFRQQFGIDAIGLRLRMLGTAGKSNSTFREVWVDPLVYYDAVAGEPEDGRQLEYIPLYGTPVRVRFTTPLDTRTVFEAGMKAYSYGNVNVNATRAEGLDFRVTSSDDEHITFGPVDGSPIDIVEFRICDPSTSPRKQALHFGNISLFCSTSLQSTTGEPLQAQFSFLLLSMERPGFGLFLERAKWSHDGDNDFWPFTNYAELYNVLYGAVLTPASSQYTDLAFIRMPDCHEQQGVPPGECVYEYSEDNGYFGFASKALLFEPSWLGDRDYVFSHIVSYDEDCKDEADCLVNNVDALLDVVREKTAGYQPSDEEKTDGITWETVVPDLIDLGAQFIQGLLPIDEQDEFIGEMTLLNSASELWGAAESTAPLIIRYHDNGEYVYKARLFPRRQPRF